MPQRDAESLQPPLAARDVARERAAQRGLQRPEGTLLRGRDAGAAQQARLDRRDDPPVVRDANRQATAQPLRELGEPEMLRRRPR